jgi:hypothetical protein
MVSPTLAVGWVPTALLLGFDPFAQHSTAVIRPAATKRKRSSCYNVAEVMR